MKKILLLVSLLFAATSAKGVYVEGATTDSSGVEAVVAAAKLGEDQRRMLGEEPPFLPPHVHWGWWCKICAFNALSAAIYDDWCKEQCRYVS